MIGKLQSNKAKEAVNLFDYIHSVDTPKLAGLISKLQLNIKPHLLELGQQFLVTEIKV